MVVFPGLGDEVVACAAAAGGAAGEDAFADEIVDIAGGGVL